MNNRTLNQFKKYLIYNLKGNFGNIQKKQNIKSSTIKNKSSLINNNIKNVTTNKWKETFKYLYEYI